MATKTFKVSLSLDNPRIIQTGIKVRSFDKQSIKIAIELIKDSQVYQIPTDAQIKISLLKLARQEQKIILDVPFTSTDSIDWVVPEYLDGYQGDVRVGVYLLRGSENIDVGYFNITSKVSDIDKAAEEFTDDVMEGWNQLVAPEVIVARNGKPNLKTRIDDLENETNAQLAQKALEEDLIVERNRINNLSTLAEGSTTGDAELIDIRVGENGKNYASAGESVRKQFEEVNEQLAEKVTIEKLDFVTIGRNKFNPKNMLSNQYINYDNGNLTASVGWSTSDFIPFDATKTPFFKGIAAGGTEYFDVVVYGAYYDENKNYLGGIKAGLIQDFSRPAKTKFVRVSAQTNRMTTYKPILGYVEDWAFPIAKSNYEPFYYTLSDYKNNPFYLKAGEISDFSWNTSTSKFETTVTKQIAFEYDTTYMIPVGTTISIPQSSLYVFNSFNKNFEVVTIASVKNHHIILLTTGAYDIDWRKNIRGVFNELAVKPEVVSLYGSGLINPFTTTAGAKFKMTLATTANLYATLDNGVVASKSIASGTVYEISPNRALVWDITDNNIKEVARAGIKKYHAILLLTGDYVNEYLRYFSGYFANRVTVQTTYEEYDKNNVRNSYVRTVDNKSIEVVNTNPEDFSFIIHADIHIVSSSVEGSRPVLNVVNRVQDSIHADAILNLGDMVMMGKENTSEAYYGLQESVSKIKDKEKAFYVVGNHDYNHRSDVAVTDQKKDWILPYTNVYKILGRQHENNVVWGSKERMYYYKDFENKKVRMIVLNTLDRPEVWVDRSGVLYDKYTWLMNVISTAQINWLIDTALNFTAKDDKSDWCVFICSHVTPAEGAEWTDAPLLNRATLRAISEAFVNGTNVALNFTDTTFDGNATISRNADFTAQGAMKLIGWFSGHSHIDTTTKVNGVNYNTTVCGYPYSIGSSNAMSGLTMTDGTYTEFGLDACVLDKASRKLTMKRFGVGSDRILTY